MIPQVFNFDPYLNTVNQYVGPKKPAVMVLHTYGIYNSYNIYIAYLTKVLYRYQIQLKPFKTHLKLSDGPAFLALSATWPSEKKVLAAPNGATE